MRRKNPEDWDAERSYIAELLRTGGNRSVPRETIASYLKSQAVWAREINMVGDEQVLKMLAHEIKRGTSPETAYDSWIAQLRFDPAKPYMDDRRSGYAPEKNPGARKSPLVRYSDTEIEKWFERDRSHVELRNKKTGETIAEWWDEDVQEEVKAGFLDPRDYHRSAYDTAVYRGLIRSNPKGKEHPRRKRNPVPKRVSSRTVAKAVKLRKRFVGRNATRATLVEIPDPPKTCVLLGEIVQINYRAQKKGDGEAGEYYHRFSRPRPRLVSDADGKRLYVVGGRFKITRRGIEH